MKKVTLVLTLIVMMLSSFTTKSIPESKASEQTAMSVVVALKHASSSEYSALYPSLAEFHQIMNENESLYGPFVKEARDEFALDYERYLMPRVKDSFNALIKEGQNNGIDWSQIRYVGVIVEEEATNVLTSVPFTIVVASQGKEFKIRIEKALFINGSWRVSQFIKLV